VVVIKKLLVDIAFLIFLLVHVFWNLMTDPRGSGHAASIIVVLFPQRYHVKVDLEGAASDARPRSHAGRPHFPKRF
jgi:hypothetical protein